MKGKEREKGKDMEGKSEIREEKVTNREEMVENEEHGGRKESDQVARRGLVLCLFSILILEYTLESLTRQLVSTEQVCMSHYTAPKG